MQLLFDLHSHSRFSADGVAEPEDMVKVHYSGWTKACQSRMRR